MVLSAESVRALRQFNSTMKEFDCSIEFFEDHPIESIAITSLRLRLEHIKPMLSTALTAYEVCSEEVSEEADRQIVEALRSFRDNYFDIVSRMKDQIELHTSAEQKNVKEKDHLSPTAVQCPRLSLPTFDGSTEQWVSFHDLFTSIVHENSSLTDMARFQHLKTCMNVPPEENVLNGYPLKAENYKAAWNAVCERYDDPRKLIAHHMSAILNSKKMVGSTASELRRLIDLFTSNINSLSQLGYKLDSNTDFANQMVVQIVTSRLHEDILREWRKDKPTHSTNWGELHAFLVQLWRSLDDTQFTITPAKDFNFKQTRSGKAHVSNSKSSAPDMKCVLCKDTHFLWNCQKFRNMSIDDRHKFVRSNKMCLNCFRKTHTYQDCTSKFRCRTCQQPHHSMLHYDKSMSQSNTALETHSPSTSNANVLSPEVKPFQPFSMLKKMNSSSQSQSSGNVMNAHQTFVSRQTMLSTIIVNVQDKNGNFQQCRALLDSGSDANIMTTKCASRLQLPFDKTFFPITGINEKTSIIKNKVETSISSRYGQFKKTIEFFLMNNITGQLPNHNLNIAQLQIPKDYFIADPEFHRSSSVDMLLSADVFYDALLSEKIYLKEGPMLIHTKFGWIIGGSIIQQSTAKTLLSCFTHKISDAEKVIEEKLQKFFLADDNEYATPARSPEEKYCEELFVATTLKDAEQKFVVQMPFKSNANQLGSNIVNAERTLKWQESMRRKDEMYNNLYVDYMENYILSGHMEEVPLKTDDFAHFLPHHGVLKLTSSSTKLRPVFNASSASETGVSLNDVLCVGPTVQPESFDILLRFREKKFVITGDITKMYRQIWIHPNHRKYLRILWRSDMNAPIKHYQLNTVTFGTACAPFLATRSLQQLAIENQENFPRASSVINNSFYVDDLVFGVDTINDGKQILNDIRYILDRSGMPLCKISANDPSLLSDVPTEDIESIEDENQVAKKLGVGYKSMYDEFCFHLKPINDKSTITKASVLSEIASIYDPIGWIGPVVLTAKLFMKQLWLLPLRWTDEVPDDFRVEWDKFRKSLSTINSIRIQRHCFINNHVVIELHGFCDASIAAYGAMIFALSHDTVGNTQMSLICSKSRVAPKNQKTLARLEMCGATLLAKLIDRTIGIFSTPIDDVTLWCDSTIVLSWISMTPSRLSTYVGNRVAVVQDLTHKYVWKHIRGIENPADIISRGLQPQEIKDCAMWWNGPQFFQLPKSQWPAPIISINEDVPEVLQEVKRSLVVREPSVLLELIETRFSRVKVLINTVAYVNRFIINCRRNIYVTQTGPLSLNEQTVAESTIIRVLQREMFFDEFKVLLKQREQRRLNENIHMGESVQHLSRSSSLVTLAPFLDDDSIIRVGGRINASPGLTWNQKHPIILPNCQFSEILIRHLHIKYLHPGPLSMLAIVRETYFPIKAKNIIRKITRQCLVCFRVKPLSSQQLMSDLPAPRVTMTQPFVCTALDYAGFFKIRASLTKKSVAAKAYVAIFKCMCTGAMHLDLVSELTTNAFIAVLDRFVSRRGLCAELFSDNATCFEGADNELKKIIAERNPMVQQYCDEQNIKWHFTTPRAPHAGGIYESGVKRMKHHLKRVMTDQLYTFEQFTTILYKIEAILNSRPLTPMTEDHHDLRVLTPGHFLIGRSMVAKPERDFIHIVASRLNRWNILQKVQQSFWAFWYHDFLHTLQTRPRQFREINPFNVGDMVLLNDINLPPMKWRMGRIVKLFPGKDKVIRNVRVLTKDGEKDRHVRYLCLLPFEAPPSDDQQQ